MVMASIYAHCGKYDQAIDTFEYLLSLEGDYTVNDIKLNPEFDVIRDEPRYKEVMAKYGGDNAGQL